MGITLNQLETEIYERLVDLAEFCANSPINDRIELVTATSIYLAEVVRRWQTPGLTLEKVTEKSYAALDRRMRKLLRERGVQELTELLKEKTDDHKSTDRETTIPSGVGPGEIGEKNAGQGSRNGKTDRTLQTERGGDTEKDTQPGASNTKPDTVEELHDGKTGRDKEEPVIKEKTCPGCHASLGPELSDPRLSGGGETLGPALRCSACGWDPRVPPEPSKKKTRKKAKTGPLPPKAGKSFSRG